MNCQNFAETISELARDRSSDQVELILREQALAHLDECSECELRFQDERALTRRLQEMSREASALTASPGIEEQLLMAFRETGRIGQRSEIRGWRSGNTSRNRWLAAAAAVVLIVLGVGAVRRYAVRPVPPGTASSEESVVTAPKSAPSIHEVRSDDPPAKPEKPVLEPVVKRPKLRRPARSFDRDSVAQKVVPATKEGAKDNETEITTQFMPLGYTGPINPQDGGQLIRVELPRTAMLSMGLPVNMDRYGERVKADVLLGADGFARAIRFVQ